MLVFGLVSPHPPIILPEVGGDELPKVKQTIEALEKAVRELAAAKPEKLIVIAPHEGHGFEVPEYFLRAELSGDMRVEEILVMEESYQYYFDYGKEVGERVRREKARYAIVASGDLSHVLKADGPYGFNAAGPVLDELIVAAVRKRDAGALLEIDPRILEDGAECGLRSILFLLGVMDGMEVKTEVLSYEGPFGVGYIVAGLEPKGGGRLPAMARASIRHYLETGKMMRVPKDLPADLRRRAGAFVSLHVHNELRGCIGTTGATKGSAAEEVIANAVAAAVEDLRFEPVRLDEVDGLEISVDVLGAAKVEDEVSRLDPKRYGIIVLAGDGRRGVLLPDLEGIDTVDDQIRICREKAGIGPDEPVEIQKFEVQRYSD